jgi:hypothetical protein
MLGLRSLAPSVLILATACGTEVTVSAPSPDADPAGRVVALTAPESERDGRTAGCFTYGAKVGSGVGNLIVLSGGMEQHLQQDPDTGRINVVMLASVAGFDPAAPAPKHFELRFFTGELARDSSFLIRKSSFVGGDVKNGPRVRFSDASSSSDGWVDTGDSAFALPIPIFNDFVGELELTAARFSGKLTVNAAGVAVEHGVITGYAAEPAIRQTMAQIDAACASPAPPELCPFVKDILASNGDGDLLPTLLTFLGGWDTRIENGHPYPCDPEASPTDCNAVSACFVTEIAPVDITGVAAE